MPRVACYLILLAVYLTSNFSAWATVSPVFWMPISFFRLLPGPPTSVLVLAILQIVWKLSLLTSALSLFPRASAAIAAALGFFLLGLPNNFGKIHHLDGFPVLLLILFALSPRDSAWPVKLGKILFLSIFAASGISKLEQSGLAWIAASNMRNLLIGNAFLHSAPTHLADWIACSPWLSQLAGIAALVIELASIPAIFICRLRTPVVLALFALQTAIALTMGIYFFPHLAGYALFVPWSRLLEYSPTRQFPVPDHRPSRD